MSEKIDGLAFHVLVGNVTKNGKKGKPKFGFTRYDFKVGDVTALLANLGSHINKAKEHNTREIVVSIKTAK